MKCSALTLALACCAALVSKPSDAAVIAGPTLEFNGGGWIYTGLSILALRPVTLTGFTYQNQGRADVVVLTDLTGAILHAIPTAAGAPTQALRVSWRLDAGHEYRLLQTVESNEKFAVFGAPLPANEDILITHASLFSYSINSFSGFAPQDYWAAFNDITTVVTVAAVPEPSIWMMLLLGFGCTGVVLRRKRTVRITLA